MKVRALQAVAPNKVELTEFPYPKVADDAILLKNLYCGVCGTDLHGIQGKRSIVFPIIPGHELVARVEEIGSRALESTKVFGGDGLDRVLSDTWVYDCKTNLLRKAGPGCETPGVIYSLRYDLFYGLVGGGYKPQTCVVFRYAPDKE